MGSVVLSHAVKCLPDKSPARTQVVTQKNWMYQTLSCSLFCVNKWRRKMLMHTWFNWSITNKENNFYLDKRRKRNTFPDLWILHCHRGALGKAIFLLSPTEPYLSLLLLYWYQGSIIKEESNNNQFVIMLPSPLNRACWAVNECGETLKDSH